MYKLLRKLLFLFPPEDVHYFSMHILRLTCSIPFIKKVLSRRFQPTGYLQKEVFGLRFRNPVGLAAGFDKNAKYLRELETLGFGFIEIGTVTPEPQAGNKKPRLFRLAEDKALVNRMGFNNDGVKIVAKRLKEWKENNRPSHSRLTTHDSRFIIGGNIGKNKATPNENAWKDYEICFIGLFDSVDYFVVNVSSPNTPGLRELQEKDSLKKILSHLQTLNQRNSSPKPILLKIAPDLSINALDDVIDLAIEIRLDGLVAANTTITRENLKTSTGQLEKIGAGGLSGKPLQQKATEVARYIQQRSNGSLPFIASGGIFTGADGIEKVESGASLVQVWTGFVFEGPSIVKNICMALEKG